MGIAEGAKYDAIGTRYAGVRAPDPRIAARVEAALGDCVSVVNVGAGTGSYESPSRRVVAVEPSEAMIRQRAPDAAPAIVAAAEALPLVSASVDAATAFYTVHHWRDQRRGLRELRRVARRRVVILTFLPGTADPASQWLTRAYFPAMAAADDGMFPPRALYEDELGPCDVSVVPVPKDCVDGFRDAYWARPERYLEAAVRAGISGFALAPQDEVRDGLARLERDLASGAWERDFGAALRGRTEVDVGLRLMVSARS